MFICTKHIAKKLIVKPQYRVDSRLIVLLDLGKININLFNKAIKLKTPQFHKK